MTNPDWADDVARAIKLDYAHGSLNAIKLSDDIATALRKAKADGMREAADFAEETFKRDGVFFWDTLRTRANEIEGEG